MTGVIILHTEGDLDRCPLSDQDKVLYGLRGLNGFLDPYPLFYGEIEGIFPCFIPLDRFLKGDDSS